MRDAKKEVTELKGMVDAYYARSDPNHYPETLDDLTRPELDSAPLLEQVPDDPWGQAYIYRPTDDHYELFSKGPDQTEGTWDDIGHEQIGD